MGTVISRDGQHRQQTGADEESKNSESNQNQKQQDIGGAKSLLNGCGDASDSSPKVMGDTHMAGTTPVKAVSNESGCSKDSGSSPVSRLSDDDTQKLEHFENGRAVNGGSLDNSAASSDSNNINGNGNANSSTPSNLPIPDRRNANGNNANGNNATSSCETSSKDGGSSKDSKGNHSKGDSSAATDDQNRRREEMLRKRKKKQKQKKKEKRRARREAQIEKGRKFDTK